MRLKNETYEYIKQAVADMFVTYDIKGIPINAFEVAIKIGLNIIPYSSSLLTITSLYPINL